MEVTIGRVYWYDPHPTQDDQKCSWCGFIFGKDHEKDAEGERGLVLVLHKARQGVTHRCPACGTHNDLQGDYYRVMDVTNHEALGRRDSVVSTQWLHEASEAEVSDEMCRMEDEVDAHNRRMSGMGLRALLGRGDDEDEDGRALP